MIRPTLSPFDLAATWYWTDPPPGWLLGMGDIVRPVPYYYRERSGLLAAAPVLAVCTEHPCDVGEGIPGRVNFARAYRLDEYVAENPQVWQSLGTIWQGNHLDFCLVPAFPGKWEVELIVDLGDQFAVNGVDVDLGNRLAGLREGYWPTFGWYVARRAGRAGFPYQPPPFDTVQVRPEADRLERPSTVPMRFFDVELRPDEAQVRPGIEPALTLTHLRREATGQDWWRAQWKGLTRASGYAMSQDEAIESLVRAVRRLVFRLSYLRPEVAGDLRAALGPAGIEL